MSFLITEQISIDRILDSKQFRSSYDKMHEQKSRQMKIKKILLIEDDLDMSDILKNRLRKMSNWCVDVAADPYEAMNLMVESYYDLIILDWNLPLLDGGETLLRAEQAMAFEPF